MFKYLVSCNGKRKEIQAKTKGEVKDLVRTSFQIPAGTNIVIQSWDKEWEEYVDVDDLDCLPDRCKINAILDTVIPVIVSSPADGSDISSNR